MPLLLMIAMLLGASLEIAGQQDTVFNLTDAQGRKQGFWKKHYPNGQLLYKGFFENDRPVGTMIRYYENGSPKAQLYYHTNGDRARAVLYYADGKKAAEGIYLREQKDSTWNYYSYYNVNLTSKESFAFGKREGFLQYFYPGGKPAEKIEYHSGTRNGIWEQFFESGIPKLKATYRDGKLEGKFVVYQENGIPFVTGNYANDNRHGKWIFYKEDGSTELEMEYENGLVSGKDLLDEKQSEFLRLIDENRGKIEEPDETNFMVPVPR